MNMTWARDAAERVAVTFVEGWLGAWLVTEGARPADLFNSTVLAVGLVAAAGALLKALAATRVGDENSASLVE